MDSVLVIGRRGQLARALCAQLGGRALAAGSQEADMRSPDFIALLERFVNGRPVGAVINAGAYTAVDKCENEGREEARRVNAAAVGELAAWCSRHALPLIHFSTDYVFDGGGSAPWKESDAPRPLNAYGHSKLAGERLLMEHGGAYLILRTSWLYDAEGKNFFTTVRRLLREKDRLDVVADQVGAPTYVPHLARAALTMLSDWKGEGIVHLCHFGETSWHGFAAAIFDHERARDPALKCQSIHPIPSSAYPLPARRPLNSRLDCGKARAMFGITMPGWEEGLRECLAHIYTH